MAMAKLAKKLIIVALKRNMMNTAVMRIKHTLCVSCDGI